MLIGLARPTAPLIADSSPAGAFHTPRAPSVLAKTPAIAPDGARFTLHEHDGDYFMKLNGRQLMSTTSTTSEILLAKLACENLSRHPHPRVLVGGLGLGFSLKAVLSIVGKKAEVHVAELLPEVVEWNRQFLTKVNGALLNDRLTHALQRSCRESAHQWYWTCSLTRRS